MIQPQTMLHVLDNSGASIVRCFNVWRKPSRKATLGDIIVGSVRETRTLENTQANSKVQRVQKGQVVRGVVVRTKKEVRRPDGSCIAFDQNACVLVDVDPKKGVMPRGTRVLGVVARELRRQNMIKILSLAPNVV